MYLHLKVLNCVKFKPDFRFEEPYICTKTNLMTVQQYDIPFKIVIIVRNRLASAVLEKLRVNLTNEA